MSDAVIDSLELNIAGRAVISGLKWQKLRADTAKTRGVDEVGFGLIDFGDDENQWLDLRDVNKAYLRVKGNAAFAVALGQDYLV